MRSSPFAVPFAALTALLFALSGCGRAPQAPPPPPTPPLVVTAVGGENLNSGGNAAVLRIYQLAGDANFRRAPVQQFWQNDEQALGAELVGTKREVLLFPGSSEVVQIDLDDATEFVAVAADFREPDQEGWRAIYPADEVRGSAVAVLVGEDRLYVRVE
jgi:type VI secretion system VasD/TssJ family lipoprotein